MPSVALPLLLTTAYDTCACLLWAVVAQHGCLSLPAHVRLFSACPWNSAQLARSFCAVGTLALAHVVLMMVACMTVQQYACSCNDICVVLH